MLFVQALTNRMGDFVPAISVAVMRVDGFAMLPNFTFGLAISTYIGQNIGARRMDRIKPGETAVLKLALGCATVLVIALLIWGKNLIGLFINQKTPNWMLREGFCLWAAWRCAFGGWVPRHGHHPDLRRHPARGGRYNVPPCTFRSLPHRCLPRAHRLRHRRT
jgi:Na+-driven multidrug efflux pump